MEARPREIQSYITEDGKNPFVDWLDSLRDIKAIARIDKRIKRVSLGNLGDCKSIGGGIYELRIDYGPGYRVYFGQLGLTIILLLLGGDKTTQEQDINKAQQYWKDHENRQNSSER